MRHRRILIGVAVVTTLFIVAGFVMAETMAGQQYTGCLSKHGFIYGVRAGDEPVRACRGRDQEIRWNETGPQGLAGKPGKDGADGVDGKDGINGVDGIDGKDGLDGSDGLAGADGINCWDLNENGMPDITTGLDNEDINGDGAVDVLDCQREGGGSSTTSVNGYEKIMVTERIFSNSEGGSFVARCGEGKFPLGGGYAFDAEPAGCVTVEASQPWIQAKGVNGWEVDVVTSCDYSFAINVYAVCAPVVDASPPAPESKTVFATKANYSGALGGVAGADLKCQTAAEQAGLAGTFRAWIQDGTSAPDNWANERNQPYVLVNGIRIADNWSDLTDYTLLAPISRDEYGLPAPGRFSMVWTGATNGGVSDVATCSGWTSNTKGDLGKAGHHEKLSNGDWNDDGEVSCHVALNLYCFEQ